MLSWPEIKAGRYHEAVGMVFAITAFLIGLISNIINPHGLPWFSQVIYSVGGMACIAAMAAFWLSSQQGYFWLSVVATTLIMYGA